MGEGIQPGFYMNYCEVLFAARSRIRSAYSAGYVSFARRLLSALRDSMEADLSPANETEVKPSAEYTALLNSLVTAQLISPEQLLLCMMKTKELTQRPLSTLPLREFFWPELGYCPTLSNHNLISMERRE